MTVVLVLMFMGVFVMILGTLVGYALQQGRYGRAIVAREQALAIAEAGIEYYRWFLTRNPSIMTGGAGLTSPYTHAVADPEGSTLGEATVTATANLQCGAVQWVDISSRGVARSGTPYARTIAARYMKRSVAEYAFLYHSSVWFGSQNRGVGPYHANNGMRMDGWTNSDVTAGVSTMTCDSSFGCSPTQTKPGVWGTSTTTALWRYPVSTIDFAGMALNFTTLRSYAQAQGVMLNPTSVTRAGVTRGGTFSSVGGTDQRGFHLVFKQDGSVDVYRVTSTNSSVYSYNDIDDWHYDYSVITAESFVTNVTLPSGCAIIFSQAKTWIEGTVSGKVTLIAADTGSYAPDIVLNNNISYASSDGTTGLTAVAEGSVQIGLVVPDTMNVRGIFVAQTGLYGRDHYVSAYTPSQYGPYINRSTLNVTGTLVSNQRGALCWGSDGSGCDSGFDARNNSYDRILAFSPPPFTPAVTTDYKLVLWREQ